MRASPQPGMTYQRPQRSLAVYAIPTALVLFAGYFAYRSVFGSGPPSTEPPPGTVPLPVAATYLAPYTRVEPGHLAVQYTRPEMIPEHILREPSEIAFRVLANAREAGNAFRESDFLPRGTRPGPTAGIPPGWVAVTIDARDIEGTVGLLNVGDHVVIAAARSDGGAGRSSRSRVLSTDARVVAPLRQRTVVGDGAEAAGGGGLVGHSHGGGARRGGGQEERLTLEMTLAVKLEEALRISDALGSSRIRIFLRTANDDEIPDDAGALGSPAPPERLELIEGDRVTSPPSPADDSSSELPRAEPPSPPAPGAGTSGAQGS